MANGDVVHDVPLTWEVVPVTFVVVWLDVVDEPEEEEAVARFIDVVVPEYGMVVSLLTNRDVVHDVPLT